ncbi:MAG: hypothetical protein H5T84_04210 [Thermoleophilia bacterium]|nr:hypothetical protein [Thermoleophilia bacterium]
MAAHQVVVVCLAGVLLVISLAGLIGGCGNGTVTSGTTAVLSATSTSLTGAAGAGTATTAETATSSDTSGGSTSTNATASGGGSSELGALVVKGLVVAPQKLTVADLKALKLSTITAEHPKLGPKQYTGVKFSDLLPILGVSGEATVVIMGASDGYMAEVPLADIAQNPDCMIAIADDGTLEAVMPGLSGKAWVRDLVSLDFN